MSSPRKSLRFIEVCAGAGGLSSGFIEAGFSPIFLNELDKTCCQTLRANHPGIEIRECSMCDLELSKYRGQVDVLMGGVPCQSFSQAGLRKGLDDDRGALIVEFNRLVKECEPKVFVIENVKGLSTHAKGKTIEHVIDFLKNSGQYRIFFKILNAKNFKIAQKRERLFIVGVHASIDRPFAFPVETGDDIRLKHVLQDVPMSPGVLYPESKKIVLDMVPPGGCWVDLPPDVQRSYVGDHMLSLGGGKRGIARRLSMEEHCLTLTTSPCQKQTERCHPLETRPFTTREYARIQSFPDSYVFCGSVLKQYKQIGNAVPVKLAYNVATCVASLLQQSHA